MNNLKNLKNFNVTISVPTSASNTKVTKKPKTKKTKSTKNEILKELDNIVQKNKEVENKPSKKKKTRSKKQTFKAVLIPNNESVKEKSKKTAKKNKNNLPTFTGTKVFSILFFVLSILLLVGSVILVVLMDNYNRHRENIMIGLSAGSLLMFILEVIIFGISARNLKKCYLKQLPTHLFKKSKGTMALNQFGVIFSTITIAMNITIFLSWFISRI